MNFRIVLLPLLMAVAMAVHATDTFVADTIKQAENSGETISRTLPAQVSSVQEVAGETASTFNPALLVVPGALITLGVIGTISDWGEKADPFHKHSTPEWHHMKRLHPDKWIQFVPSVFGIGLNACGVKSPYTRSERLMLRVTSLALSTSLTYVLKHTVREWRPNGEDHYAFPSCHTSTAFQGAELVRMEYGSWYGVAAYAMATGVAVERVVYDKHWLHDVVAGAGIGILCARASMWLLPLKKKVFQGIGGKRTAAFVPYYDVSRKTVGGSFAMTF